MKTKTRHPRLFVSEARANADDEAERGPSRASTVLRDGRFSALLGRRAWSALPPEIQARFSKRPAGGTAVVYRGRIIECEMSHAGWLLARMCRAIGGPLPLRRDIGVPAVVTVTEDAASGGQFWTRLYSQARGFPQVIHSVKRFRGPTGLEEYLGRGFGIALTIAADARALHFHAVHYFLALGPIRLRLPRWLAPGALTISHVAHEDGWFAFVLSLRHPLFGTLIQQTGLFHEVTEDARDD
jgi:hypothetical protein